MPHVEVSGPSDLSAFHAAFRPREIRDGDAILKAEAAYLRQDGAVLLIECLTVEGYLRQSFFALLSSRPPATMVRLLPRTSPEKTDAVKRCVAWIALWYRSSGEGRALSKTNLEEFLSPPFPGGALEV